MSARAIHRDGLSAPIARQAVRLDVCNGGQAAAQRDRAAHVEQNCIGADAGDAVVLAVLVFAAVLASRSVQCIATLPSVSVSTVIVAAPANPEVARKKNESAIAPRATR